MRFDVVIVGGGLAGTALAVALRAARLSIALIEGRAPLRPAEWDTRIYAISPANMRFLSGIGVWKNLDHKRVQAVEHMDIRGDTTGHLQFSAYDSGADELAWICESSSIQCELWECAKRQANLKLICPGRPQRMEVSAESVILTLADGDTLETRLLVGADGADSWTRQHAGIATTQRPYGQLAVVANFGTEKPHRGTAFQWFRGDDTLAWLPLPGNRMSMVWSLGTDVARSLLELPGHLFAQEVQRAGHGQLGNLTLDSTPVAFPLRLMRASRSIGHRVALIGDAVHVIHPLSGHGINLGFQDAASLAQVLLEKPDHVDCGGIALLRRHERGRKEEVLALQAVTDTLHRLFSQTGDPMSPWLPLRNMGMSLTNRIPVVKDMLVRYALAS